MCAHGYPIKNAFLCYACNKHTHTHHTCTQPCTNIQVRARGELVPWWVSRLLHHWQGRAPHCSFWMLSGYQYICSSLVVPMISSLCGTFRVRGKGGNAVRERREGKAVRREGRMEEDGGGEGRGGRIVVICSDQHLCVDCSCVCIIWVLCTVLYCEYIRC